MSQAGALGSGGGAFAPNSTINEYDDFLSDSQNNLWYIGKLWWGNDNHNFQLTSGIAGHDGVLVATNGNNSQGMLLCDYNGNNYPFLLGSGQIFINWVFKFTDLSVPGARYFAQIGFGDKNSTTEYNNGCYFQYEDDINSGNWVLKTANNGVRTAVNTAISPDTNWHNFGVVVNANASLVTYYIDGVSIGTVSTNIPAVAITARWNVFPNGGTAPLHFIDLFYYSRTFTSAR